LDVMMPAGAPSSKEGEVPSSEKSTPIPAPPLGLGRGLAEPSVRTIVNPEETREETRSFEYERARAFSDGERKEAEPRTGKGVLEGREVVGGESNGMIGTGGGEGGGVGAQGGSGAMLKRDGNGVCWEILMTEEESLASSSGDRFLVWTRWESMEGKKGRIGREEGRERQSLVIGEQGGRRLSFSANIAECWRRRRRRGSRLRTASNAEGRTLGRTPRTQVRACFWDLTRMEEVEEDIEERQTEPHSRTGRIHEQYKRRFVGMSAPQDVPETDLRTLERDSALEDEIRTWDLKERWLSM